MPFQPINFAAIPPIGRPALADLIPTLMQGYAASQMPAQMRRQAQKEQLANQLLGYQVQQEPQAFASEQKGRDLANAMAAMLNQEQPDKFNSAMADAIANRNLANAQTSRITKMTPYEVDKARMGVDPQYTGNYFSTLANVMNSLNQRQGPNANVPSEGQTGFGVLAPGQSLPNQGNQNLTITPNQANALANSGIGQPGMYDPAALMQSFLKLPMTPQQKAQMQVDVANAKLQNKTNMPTPAFLTQNQKAMQAIENVLPALDELKAMNIPGQLLGKYMPWNTDAQAAYISKLGGIKDTLQKAFTLNPSDEVLKMMNDIVGMQPRESSAGFAKKIDALKEELKKRYKNYAANSKQAAGTNSANMNYVPSKSLNLMTGKFE